MAKAPIVASFARRTRLTWPDSVYVTYEHDLYGAMTAVKLSGSTSLTAYAYDDLGRLTGVTRGNGASTAYSYDAVSRLTSMVQNPKTLTLGGIEGSALIGRPQMS